MEQAEPESTFQQGNSFAVDDVGLQQAGNMNIDVPTCNI